MKPSNTGFSDPSIKTGTGIDWLRLTTIPSHVADAISGNITEREFVTVCEWAAQFAIAKYRKEAKAEWQRELAARVEDAFCELKQALAEQGAIDAFDLACVENALVGSILNENDDAE